MCDYTRPGVSQRPPKARWLTFEHGPGGRPLGAAPTSQGPLHVLADLVVTLASLNLDANSTRTLVKEIEKAAQQLPRLNTPQVCRALEAFVTVVEGEFRDRLPADQAATLVADARDLASLIGC